MTQSTYKLCQLWQQNPVNITPILFTPTEFALLVTTGPNTPYFENVVAIGHAPTKENIK